MPIEQASVRAVRKPWGVSDLQPWSSIDGTDGNVGELCFERRDADAPIPALLAGGRGSIEVGGSGLSALMAYPASAPVHGLLQKLSAHSADLVRSPASEPTGLAEVSA